MRDKPVRKLKVLDKYILKSFLKSFLATFFIILFILVMQILWMTLESFAGKGITSFIVLKFLWYTLLVVASQAFPIGVLLSSIMTLGNMSEKYEFAAVKSAGISLQRLLRPLILMVFFLSLINFGFLNNVYPYAMLKSLNLKMNIKQKEPSLALVPGSFNKEIPNYQIKFDEKYGEKGNLLKNIIIYDLSSGKGNTKIITAERGEFVSEIGSRYMTLILRKGHFFEHHINNRTPYEKRKRMPASYADFDEYTINVDISDLMDDDLEKQRYTRNYNMLSLSQLNDTLPAMKGEYDTYIKNQARSLALDVKASKLYKTDTLKNKKIVTSLLDNFNEKEQVDILNSASHKIKRRIDHIYSDTNKYRFRIERKKVNLYNTEFYNRLALSLSCLLLFFIGAPLGSIINKGGMGLPMILAIVIYVTFHFSNTFGKNMAEDSTITSFVGAWVSTIIMLPLAIILSLRASKDKGFDGLFSRFNYVLAFGKKHNYHEVEHFKDTKSLLEFYFKQYKIVATIVLVLYVIFSITLFFALKDTIELAFIMCAVVLCFFLANLMYTINYNKKIFSLLEEERKPISVYLLFILGLPLYFIVYFYTIIDLKNKISEYHK